MQLGWRDWQMIICKRPAPQVDHLQEAGHSEWSFARDWPLRMIIYKRPSPLDDHLQEAVPSVTPTTRNPTSPSLSPGGHGWRNRMILLRIFIWLISVCVLDFCGFSMRSLSDKTLSKYHKNSQGTQHGTPRCARICSSSLWTSSNSRSTARTLPPSSSSWSGLPCPDLKADAFKKFIH